VILKKFGLHESHLRKLKDWAYSFNVALGGVRPSPELLAGVERSITEMDELFIPEIAKRRANPGDDFLSQLVLARDHEDKLSEEEILGICYLVIVAGHDTTLNSMTLGVAALADNPGPRQYLLDHPDKILDSTMEVMRYSAMSTAFNRVAAENFEWHGKQIKKGDNVWMMTAGANRDPRIFENPEAMDMTRPQDRSTVFGPGIHHCIGHLLAKMQLTEFFPEFFRRFPNAKVLDKELDFQPALSFRGLNSLHVKL
jgi:cytochrome P450